MRADATNRHSWNLAPREAVAVQRALADRVLIESLEGRLATVAGVDVSVRGHRARAAVVVVDVDGLAPVEVATAEASLTFPYVPGLLSFREMPAVIAALERLTTRPDVFMLDAQGYAHPRRFGLACHLGVYYDVPTVGVAKTRLVGSYSEPAPTRGATSDLLHEGAVVGRVVRTRTSVRPVFVSVGHRVTLEDAVALTLRCSTRFKLPEPARLAHRLSKTGRL